MQSITIRPCTVDDILAAPNLGALVVEYAVECAIDGLGEPHPRWDTYHKFEAAGVLHIVGAFEGSELIGFIVLLVAELPHYSAIVATTESFFVADRARKGGAGLKLLREAERVCAALGAVGFLVSAPANGRLAKIMPRIGFRESNRVFFRKLA